MFLKQAEVKTFCFCFTYKIISICYCSKRQRAPTFFFFEKHETRIPLLQTTRKSALQKEKSPVWESVAGYQAQANVNKDKLSTITWGKGGGSSTYVAKSVDSPSFGFGFLSTLWMMYPFREKIKHNLKLIVNQQTMGSNCAQTIDITH